MDFLVFLEISGYVALLIGLGGIARLAYDRWERYSEQKEVRRNAIFVAILNELREANGKEPDPWIGKS